VALLPRSAEGKPYLRPDFPPHWPRSGVAEEDWATRHPRGCEAAPGDRCRVGWFDLADGLFVRAMDRMVLCGRIGAG